MRVWIAGLALLWMSFALAGCETLSDPLGRKDALSLAQKNYTEAVRWGKLDLARSFVNPEHRDAFRDLESAFEGIRLTDFEIGEIEMDEDDEMVASVTVTYRGYAVAYQVEQPVREDQEWTRIEGLANLWQVESNLHEVVATLLGPPQ
jgi:hypothetical protein